MPNTRRSSLSKKSEDESKDEKTLNPKSLLKNIVQLNETVAPSQPDDSPTVTNIKQMGSRRSSRRSSGMRALNKTPHALLKNFIENAQEETPAQLSSADEASTHSDSYLAPIPRKISKMDVDDQNVSSEGDEDTDVVRKMPRLRQKVLVQNLLENLKQQSESPGEESGSEIKQLPSRAKKIRNKITAEDIASGIKLSQEKAAEIEKSHNVAEATKTELSLAYLSVNTLNAENLQDTITAVPETQEKTDSLAKNEEKEDSASSKSENSSKRKRSMLRLSNVESFIDLSDEEEETMQKAKMLRLRADTAAFENVKPAEMEKTDVTNFVSEAELPEVAHTVEVGEAVESGNLEESGSHVVESKEIVQSLGKDTEQTPEETKTANDDSIQLKLSEIGKLLQESIDAVKEASKKEIPYKKKKDVADMSDTKRTNSSTVADMSDTKRTYSSTVADMSDTKRTNSSTVADMSDTKRTNSSTVADGEQIDHNSPHAVSKTSNEIDMETANVSSDSKKPSSNLEDHEAVSDFPKGDDFDVSKGSGSKEYLAESIDSSYVEATSKISELQRFTAEKSKMPHLASKMEETPASGDPRTSDVDEITTGEFESNFGPVSVKDTSVSMISRECSPIVSETSEVPVQSNETNVEEKVEQSKETVVLPEDKNEEPKNNELQSLRVSTDEQDELFPSSPKETTSSGHSRSSTPASSEADKSTKRLTLPSSKSAFVEMKSARSNVLSPSTSGISKKGISSVKKSSKNEKSSYRVIDSVASPTESALGIEVSHLTRDAQILPQSPFGTMRTLQYAAERPVAPEPQAGPSQNATNVSKVTKKNKITAHLKKYVIPPRVTSLLINHYSGLKIPSACLPDLGKISDRFFDNLFDALSSYAKHASRGKIEALDVELYFKRIGLINNDKSLNTLIREYLPLEDQQLLIPVARAGNVITGGLSKKKK